MLDFEKRVGYLKQRTVINFVDFDTECIEQASLNDNAYEGLADASKDRDEAKLALERYEAELGEIARTELPKTGQKVTEKTIEELILTDGKRLDLAKSVIEADYKVAIFKGLTTSYSQKAEMLKLEGNRIASGLFGNVIIKGGEEQAKSNKYEDAKKGMKKLRDDSK